MHIVHNKSNSKNSKKIYESILLRESYRQDGKVKKRTLANLSNCTPGEIKAIEFALKHKDDLSALSTVKDVSMQQGLSVGAVWTVYQVAKKLKIDKALGEDFQAKLALWQIIARVIDQGSRLSAVRLAQNHAACDTLAMQRGFDENDLYVNLKWLAKHQQDIEKRLFSQKHREKPPEIFLYDVTSSYLEGQYNYFGAYGYNRDGKKGKKQIVIGMLCDETGDPLSTEVFFGNTKDPQTFYSQVQKVSERFGCKRVTFVGDRGMIKSAQIDQLPEDFHYITAITKPQINTLIKDKLVQLEMFDRDLCEIEKEGTRYILRRNPIRAEEMAGSRLSKIESIEKKLEQKNKYLEEHPKAKVETAQKEIEKKLKQLKVETWLSIKVKERRLELEPDENRLNEVSMLDGCYVIKTDLPQEAAAKHTVHQRYKDLAEVERVFRECKTGHLEIRPVFVQNQESTQGHVFVVMLAYKITRDLRKAWDQLDLTVKEGLGQLATVCSIELKIKNKDSCIKIPSPRPELQELLKKLNISMPPVLPHRDVPVVTRKKLHKQRKSA